jgi:hypothetical protein
MTTGSVFNTPSWCNLNPTQGTHCLLPPAVLLLPRPIRYVLAANVLADTIVLCAAALPKPQFKQCLLHQHNITLYMHHSLGAHHQVRYQQAHIILENGLY